jgi:hypothetical protein
MKNKLAFMFGGGVLGFLILIAVSAVTGARPWETHPTDTLAGAAVAQPFAMVAQVHAQQMPEGMMKGGMEKGMTPDTMMMSGMMAQQQETAKLIDQLTTSFAAVEAEKDPTNLKTKLAEHGALLKQLQTKSQESMRMMHEHMTACPMMKGEMMKGGMMDGGMMKGDIKK